MEPSEIILGEGYFCKPEYIAWKFFSKALKEEELDALFPY